MADSIRQRIERNAANRDDLMLAWARQQLVPRDEHDAAVAEAVEGERKRCARVAEHLASGIERSSYPMGQLAVNWPEINAYRRVAAAIRQPTQGGKET